ncbi:hypothetical protein [Rhodovibrio salinarum]|uniref:Uncharacterized protein n=1 Tax=Rhodovibrio salinarum TaxID=1087 RepID=A0A934V1N7_9PROT|nr:hypothetical protein [Rhodovibrio salinarum]MBK1698636.1 hypothetical protein [Rhodovibrio salinarum]
MRRLYTGNAHKLGIVLATPMLLIALLVLLFQEQGKLLLSLALLTLAGLLYGSVVLIQYVDKTLVERRHGRR